MEKAQNPIKRKGILKNTQKPLEQEISFDQINGSLEIQKNKVK
jgi:hypothetical protein